MPTERREVEFVKLVAAGNHFVLLDADRDPPPPDVAAFAVRACQPATGIGADGVLLVRRTGADEVRLTVFNPDGSVAKMCGNGARCAAFYVLREDGGSQLSVTLGRDRLYTLQARLERSGEFVELSSPQPLAAVGPIRLDGFDYFTVDTGTEYAVAFVDDVDRIDMATVGPAIRYHPHFAPGGTSVSFAELRPDGLRVRTYERGNEAETLSCASGAVACAVVARTLSLPISDRVAVHNRSADPLSVRIIGPAPPFAALTSTASVARVFAGTVEV
ncbi:diaminopimelate epimerase [Catenulispora rubra]|uniref:diaminopimelate epimerase n=1 Tax=Catenulispora rubra TaxID=280293 RepID=UPI0018924522|nr:diaminopimelate epimerase [Catenulispora rubra]